MLLAFLGFWLSKHNSSWDQHVFWPYLASGFIFANGHLGYFVVNKNFSFKTEAKRDNNYFFLYFIGMLLGAALNFSVYTVTVISGITPAGSLAIAIAITALFNFATSRFIFSRVPH